MTKQGWNGSGKAGRITWIPAFVLVFSTFLAEEACPGPTYYLGDLKEAVVGKTGKEVRDLLGPPNNFKPTQNDEKGSWEYGYSDKFTWGMHWNVIDEASGNHCWVVDIDFENGRAVAVLATNCKD